MLAFHMCLFGDFIEAVKTNSQDLDAMFNCSIDHLIVCPS